MPARSLRVPHAWFVQQNAKHMGIAGALPTLEPNLQKALAEMLLIRLFDDLQEAVAGIAYRLACGSPYIDGTPAGLLSAQARSNDGARTLFEWHNRGRHQHVKWSRAKYIKDTVQHVIDPGDPFVRACDSHALILSEMQAVRNRIAHRNPTSRAKFNVVLGRYYGGTPRGVTPGLLLLASRAAPPPLYRYLAVTRVIVKDCARA